MSLLALMACAAKPETVGLKTQYVTPVQSGSRDAIDKQVLTGNLRLLTLNVAHGRKDALNQLFRSEQTIRNNLTEIATLLKQVGADVVALQEADGPSRWSGNFDHVELLAQLAGYSWHARASHAQSSLFDYGTAILSKTELRDVVIHSFTPSPPTLTKGFVLGQIEWLPNPETISPVVVDVISVHLDFSRADVRQQQIEEMIDVLTDRKKPVIILGDFNSDWLSDTSEMHELICRGHLHAYRPLAHDLGTYRKNGRRLDWILLSQELDFEKYVVLPDVVSDHHAVVAEVFLRDVQNIKHDATDNTFNCDKNTGNR